MKISGTVRTPALGMEIADPGMADDQRKPGVIAAVKSHTPASSAMANVTALMTEPSS